MQATHRIYLDHGASTPVDPRVLEAMMPYWTAEYGNPSSSHSYGRSAETALENARALVADLLGAEPGEIVFTGCGSESDNLALRGTMLTARALAGGDGRANHMIISAIEHSAIMKTARQMQDLLGFEVTVLPVNRYGQIDINDLEAAMRPDTVLVSIMAANNEIGTLQPFHEIGEIAHAHGALFHSDAVQAAPVMPWTLKRMPIDLMSIAPHKFYGPKGVGVLYARKGVALTPNLTGGDQEDGRRAGTENVAFAVGAAEALRLAVEEMDARNAHYQALRDRLIDGILAALPETCVLTGHPTERLPHNASFAVKGISGNDLLIHLDMEGIAASSGSACKVGDPKPSATLQAIGLGDDWTKGGLRLTVGKQNTSEEIDFVLEKIPVIVRKLRLLNQVAV